MAPRSVLHGDAALRWELWGGGGPGREKVGDTRREKPPPFVFITKNGALFGMLAPLQMGLQ